MNRTTSTRRRLGRGSLVAVLIGLLTAAFIVVAPMPRATAAFGKPTSVDARAISGSRSLSVTWKAPSDGTPAAYRVLYGTSSSASKASSKYVTGTTATIMNLSARAYYYVWVQPWSSASSSGTSTGAISSSDRVKTSNYEYDAPVDVDAVNPTKTTIELTWRTVTGSPGYVMRAQATGYATKYQYGFDGSGIFTGLTPGVSYKFTVANRQPVAGNTELPGVLVSGYSSVSSTMKTNPTSVELPDGTTTPMLEQPTDLTVTETDHESVGLTWTPPSGYDPDKHLFRVYWAEDQEMVRNASYTNLTGTSGTVHDLDSNTNYYLRIRMVQNFTDAAGKVTTIAVSDRTATTMAKTRSPKGYITGTVNGASGSVLADYVAIAYAKSSGDVNGQVPVSSSGRYRLELRPGAYYIQLAYVGSGNYSSVWVSSAGSPAYTREESTTVTAKLGNDPVAASTEAVSEGAILTGRVVNSTGSAVRDVFVSARTAWTTSREVVGQFSTDSSGNFTLRGLPPERTVYLRANGSLIGKGAASTAVIETPGAGDTRSVATITVPN